MKRFIMVLALLCGGIGVAGLAGCVQPQATWYEQRCLNYGLTRGTPAFESCIERDRQWLEQERARSRRPGGNA
tara:strand:- start:19 stop:237 length:219 start_codon:yes stop_codon:yes gene_type:complete